ncbi:hypothetical protein [Inquilinus sp.]|uniref:hypothetical protein n=1 Tax=Inquilinus sp. TaxID=1932117 RepID=UPI0031D84B8C
MPRDVITEPTTNPVVLPLPGSAHDDPNEYIDGLLNMGWDFSLYQYEDGERWPADHWDFRRSMALGYRGDRLEADSQNARHDALTEKWLATPERRERVFDELLRRGYKIEPKRKHWPLPTREQFDAVAWISEARTAGIGLSIGAWNELKFDLSNAAPGAYERLIHGETSGIAMWREAVKIELRGGNNRAAA